MANLSSAYGTLTIPHWLLEDDNLGEILHRFFKEYNPPYYGVTYWEINPHYIYKAVEDGCDWDITFFGTGRWAFYSCVEDADWFFYTEGNPAGAELVKYLESFHYVELPIQWCDEEGGGDVLYEAEGFICTGDNGKLMFKETSCTDYDYNDANLIKLGFYEEAYNNVADICEDLEKILGRKLSDAEHEYVAEELEFRGGAFTDWRFDEVYFEVRDGLI